MAKCPPIPKKVSTAGKTLSTSTSKKAKSEAGTTLKKHQDKKH